MQCSEIMVRGAFSVFPIGVAENKNKQQTTQQDHSYMFLSSFFLYLCLFFFNLKKKKNFLAPYTSAAEYNCRDEAEYAIFRLIINNVISNY